MSNFFPAALTVAGSDSGGGAGIQADLRTFNAFKVYGCSAITAVTAQNPAEVRRVDTLDPEAVRSQMQSVLDVFPIRFAKTGMLASSRIIAAVTDVVQQRHLQLVVDPVMVSTSGTKLLEESAVSAMTGLLFPCAAWITPNIPEAELICQRQLRTPDDLAAAAMTIFQRFRCGVILKSGHALSASGSVTDIICYQGELFALSSPAAAVDGSTTHGTGCTLSAAITANLALGKTWQEALTAAKAFVYGSLLENRRLNGTLSQMYPPEKEYYDQVTLSTY